jgi:hypothetical protein
MSILRCGVVLGLIVAGGFLAGPVASAGLNGMNWNSVRLECFVRGYSGDTATVVVRNASTRDVPAGALIEIRGSESGGTVVSVVRGISPGRREMYEGVRMAGDNCSAVLTMALAP